MMLADIPMGYIADLYGPKRVFLSAILLRSFAFIIFLFSQNSFAFLLTGNFLAGISVAFMSNAFLMQINLLNEQKLLENNDSKNQGNRVNQGTPKKLTLQNIMLSNFFFKSMGLFFGCVLSYILIKHWEIKYIWLTSAFLSFLLFIYILITWHHVKNENQNNPFKQIKLAISILFNHHALSMTFIINMLVTILSCALLNNWVIVFVPELEKSVNSLILAYLLFYALKLGIATFWNRSHLLRFFTLESLMIFLGTSFLIFYFNSYLIQVLTFMSLILFLSGIEIQLKNRLLENLTHTPSGTILSLYSMLENLAGALSLLLCGYFLHYMPILHVWMMLGGLVTILFFVLSTAHVNKLFVRNKTIN